MKKYLIATVFTFVASVAGPVPAAQAVVCGDFTSLGQGCDLIGGVRGVCVEDEFGGIYCSAQAAGNGGVNPNSGSGTSVPGGINTGVITPYSEGIKNVINNILVPVLFAIAFIVFLWGVYKYFILGAADEKSRADGRQFVLWGIIGFVVILTVWGLVAIVSGALGLQMGGAAPRTPTL